MLEFIQNLPEEAKSLKNMLGLLDGKLVYMQAAVVCQERKSSDYILAEEYYQSIMALTDDYNANSGNGANKMFSTANSEFARFRTMQISYQ